MDVESESELDVDLDVDVDVVVGIRMPSGGCDVALANGLLSGFNTFMALSF